MPTRMTTVGGQTFATPDHLAMNGAQRQAYLPNNSTQEGFGAPPTTSDLDWQRQMLAARERGRVGEGVMSLSGARGAQPVWSGGRG
jgi:hypothetical protein